MDLALYAVIQLLFATCSTVHLALCWKLRSSGKRRAFLAFALLPLAPYLGLRHSLRGLSFAWMSSALLYFFALLAGVGG